jgi:hypothetical protein
MSNRNGPQWEGYSCTKDPKGCVRGQCTMCSFYKPDNGSMSLPAVLLLVLTLLVAVPGFMLLCYFFTTVMLVIGLIVFLTLFLFLSQTPPEEVELVPVCPCCGKKKSDDGQTTCNECRSTQVNKVDYKA